MDKETGGWKVDCAALKELVKQYAYSIGINKIGFTDAKPLLEHLPRLIRRAEAGYRHAINEGSPEKRVNPQVHLPGAKSVISTAVVYPGCADEKAPASGGARGRLSCISRGRDYHVIMRRKLEKLKQYILTVRPEAKMKLMVDKEEILEKAIAAKAGLGWLGRNTLLVTPEFGSWVVLGEIITDVPFPADQTLEGGCGSCRACVAACPTAALDDDININLDRCLAAVTLSRSLPDPEVRSQMGQTLYGCDVCQSVCPHNKRQPAYDADFAYTGDQAFPPLARVLDLTNREFKESFGHTSGAWRGRTPIQRNAVIAAGNLRDRSMVPRLITLLSEDPRGVIRGAAAWALGQIGDNQGLPALQQAMRKENDPAVLKEISYALKNFQGHQ